MWGLHIGTCMRCGRKSIDQVTGLTEQCPSRDAAGIGVARSKHKDILLHILQT